MEQVKLIIPDNWNDITIETYQKYVVIQEGKGSEKKQGYKEFSFIMWYNYCNSKENAL